MRAATLVLALALVLPAFSLAAPSASACHDWRHCIADCAREVLQETFEWVESLGQDPILASCGW